VRPVFRLCYVDGPWAWFTTRDPFTEQWGDDWNDAPYQDNAGDPNEWRPDRGVPEYRLLKVAYDGPLYTPADRGLSRSVQEINETGLPWLLSQYVPAEVEILGGALFHEFERTVRQVGGRVYRAPSIRVSVGVG
jgi:hypothetical protein